MAKKTLYRAVYERDEDGRWNVEIPSVHGGYRFDDADVWMIVGANPVVAMSNGIPNSNPARHLHKARQRGLKLIVIDPRVTEVARAAHIHLQPRPGEDPTLLAAMLHWIMRESRHDAEFLAENVVGFEELRRAVAPFTPEYAARRADVPVEKLIEAARTFAEAGRACGTAGTGPNMAGRGNLTEYLLLTLNSVCGHWPRAGEPFSNPFSNPFAFLPPYTARAQADAPQPGWGFGEKLRVRGLTDSAAGLPTAALADEILQEGEGQVRALINLGGNPMAAWPDQLKTQEAMPRAFGRAGPVVHSFLFAIYHFAEPWVVPVRTLALLPLIYATRYTRSLVPGVVSHGLANLSGVIASVLQR